MKKLRICRSDEADWILVGEGVKRLELQKKGSNWRQAEKEQSMEYSP